MSKIQIVFFMGSPDFYRIRIVLFRISFRKAEEQSFVRIGGAANRARRLSSWGNAACKRICMKAGILSVF